MKHKVQAAPINSLKEPSRSKKKLSKRIKRVTRLIWCKLEPQAKAIEAGRCELVEALTPPHVQVFPKPVFHGLQPYDQVSAPVVRKLDPITLTRHRRVRVIGGSNFLLHGLVAVHPDIYVPERDRSPIEIYGKSRIDAGSFARIRIPLGVSVGTVPRAINICDQTHHNYSHWLTEILPKLALLNEHPEWGGWPVLVDSGVGTNHLESICAAYPSVTEFIRLPPYEHLFVHELINISPTSYCPHEFRDFNRAMKAGFQFFFSGWALDSLRRSLRKYYQRYANSRPRKLYLKRTPLWTYNNRNIENIDEIEDLLDDRGVELLNVTGMTFEQQAKLFMNAEIIIAPTGAALANMIFAPAGCRIIVFASANADANYDYFYRIAYLLGHDLSFVIGPQTEDEGHHMNRDYRIDIDDLKLALDCVMGDGKVKVNGTFVITDNRAVGEDHVVTELAQKSEPKARRR